jgi:hypothetical protein
MITLYYSAEDSATGAPICDRHLSEKLQKACADGTIGDSYPFCQSCKDDFATPHNDPHFLERFPRLFVCDECYSVRSALEMYANCLPDVTYVGSTLV